MTHSSWLTAATRFGSRFIARLPFGRQRWCNICHRQLRRFLPYRGGWRDMPEVVQKLDIIGSDVQNFECPWCGCHDRERHLLMYLEASGRLQLFRNSKILHFAPEHHLRCLIQSTNPAEYIGADLFPMNPEVQKIDIQNISYPEEYFDFVIANHVLEHVEDEELALREIIRVLRPGGHAILQTPYARCLSTTLADHAINTASARLAAYGQEDHVRLFGADIVGQFERSGLSAMVCTHADLLTEIDPVRTGVNTAEPFFLFQRPLCP
ncbi:MAG: methyltransferase domain-containing protein [Betaproteobacteria bacterium]